MSDVIYLSNVRLSFPHLVEARASTEGAPKKFSADFILPTDHSGLKQFMEAVSRIASAKWGEHTQNVLGLIQNDRKFRCYGSGSEKIDKKTFKPYSGYEGMVYIGANTDKMPQMIQGDGTPVDAGNTMAYQALARKMYGGCYVNVALKPWLQDNKHGRGVRCELIAIQFSADGEAFGEANVDAAPMFGAVAAQPSAEASAPAMPWATA